MAVIPAEIRATVKLYLDGKIRVVFARRWQRRRLPGRREDRGRSTSHYGNAAAREGTVDGSRIRSRQTLDAAEGIDGPRSAAVTLCAIALLREAPPGYPFRTMVRREDGRNAQLKE